MVIMVRITKSFSIEIEKDGYKITFTPDEIKELKRQLDAAIREKGKREVEKEEEGVSTVIGQRRSRKTKQHQQKSKIKSKSASLPSTAGKVVHMSEDKRKAIMDNVNKKLSSVTPKTLSALLDGVSYVPNYLPAIRKMVESRDDVVKKQVGKRTLYSLKEKA
nr:hypothetical protein Josef01_10c16_36 [uncultured archaeon]